MQHNPTRQATYNAKRRAEYATLSVEERQTKGRVSTLAKHGLSINDYNRIYEDQQGLCLICRLAFELCGRDGLHVDHNHKTGDIRGLLCHYCNTKLVAFYEQIVDRGLLETIQAYVNHSPFVGPLCPSKEERARARHTVNVRRRRAEIKAALIASKGLIAA